MIRNTDRTILAGRFLMVDIAIAPDIGLEAAQDVLHAGSDEIQGYFAQKMLDERARAALRKALQFD